MQGVFHRRGVIGTDLQSARHFAKHTHDEFGIGLIVSGAQRSRSGRGLVEAGASDIISVNPGEVHDGEPIGGIPRRWRMLYIAPRLMEEFGADLRSGRKSDVEFVSPHFPAHRAAAQFLALHEYLRKGGQSDDLFAEENLLTLLSFFCNPERTLERPSRYCETVKLAVDAICSMPAYPHTLQSLALLSQTSRFQLIRAFRKQTGMTPHAYVVQRRLALAKSKLLSKQPIAMIAADCGFTDQSHLNRLFLRQFGYTPGTLALALRAS